MARYTCHRIFYQSDNRLNPEYYCCNGDWSDNCAGCIPANVTDRENFIDGCGYIHKRWVDYLNYMVNEVLYLPFNC